MKKKKITAASLNYLIGLGGGGAGRGCWGVVGVLRSHYKLPGFLPTRHIKADTTTTTNCLPHTLSEAF